MIIELFGTTYIPRRLFCIGRNYVAHAEELGNLVPESPVVFMKPPTCLVPRGAPISLPGHGDDLHFETELVILIGTEGRANSVEEALAFVEGLSLGLDLTLRDVQSALKAKGLPWEKAKAFDGSAPLGSFIPFDDSINLADISFTCDVNGQRRQNGHTANMIFSIPTLIMELSAIWSLKPGDLIFTGTPEGVGPLRAGDTITIANSRIGSFSWEVQGKQ